MIKLDKRIYDWLKLATRPTGNLYNAMIHVGDDVIWSTDGVRLHCIGDPRTSITASYLPTGYKKFLSKIRDQIPTELGEPGQQPPSISGMFSIDTVAKFKITDTIYHSLEQINNIADAVEITVSDGAITTVCDIPPFGLVEAKIGFGKGAGKTIVNPKYLLESDIVSGNTLPRSIVEIPEYFLEQPVKVTSKYKDYNLFALVMSIVIARSKYTEQGYGYALRQLSAF